MSELKYNSQTGNYEAPVDGGTLIVEGDTFSETYPGEAPTEAYEPETWLNCVDGETVRVEG